MRKLCDDAKLALTDLFHFGNYYWGLQLEEKPHRWMCDELMSSLTMDEAPHLLLDVPRGTYKTSIVSAGAVLQQLRQIFLFDNPYHRLIYASNTLDLGESFLNLIESVLRSGGHEQRMNRDFGPLWKEATGEKRKTSRQKDGIFLKPRMDAPGIASIKEPSFFIASIGKIRVGYHADAAILDDLNDRKNVGTPEQIRKTQQFYRQVYPLIHTTDRLGHRTHIWMCATPWADNDVRGMIVRQEEERKIEDETYQSEWRVLKATAHQEDGSLFFPTKLSEKELGRLKESMGDEYFAAYEGSPVTERNSLASSDQIRYRSRVEFPALRWCRITVDPNQHNDARVLGCYAAVVLGGYDQFAKLWVWDIRASREWDTAGLISVLYEVQDEHPTWPLFIEDAHMTHFDHAVNLEYVARMDAAEKKAAKGEPYVPVTKLRLNWVPAPRNMSKYERWQALKPRFQSGSIVFAQEIAASIKSELENEVTRGMAARFKDILDALSMMENGIVPRFNAQGQAQRVMTGKPAEAALTNTYNFGNAFGGMVDGG